ncbi:lysophosphatidic acid receptor 6-like [Clytia hemisphaerica]|uniref:lysophosphatidic acid receptor 6-like n=1 Tax=Clytia hemisphaerica TaxID=252671 RepID=UPI0034D40452
MHLNLTSNNTVIHLRCLTVEFKYDFAQDSSIVNTLVIILLSIAVIPTTLLNTVSVYVFSRKEIRKRIPTNILILASCIVDLLNGSISIPTCIAHYGLIISSRHYECPLYVIMLSAGQSISWISAVMTLIISIDRYLAIFYPYFYESWCVNRPSLYYGLCSGTCLFSIIMVIVSFSQVGFQPVLYLTGSVPLIVVISFYTHLRISCTVSQIKRRITQQSSADTSNNNINNTATVKPNKKLTRKSTVLDTRKTSSVAVFMLCLLCLCYTPYFVVILLWKIRLIETGLNPTVGQYTASSLAAVFVLYRSCFNPLIYIYTMPSVRRHKRFFKR